LGKKKEKRKKKKGRSSRKGTKGAKDTEGSSERKKKREKSKNVVFLIPLPFVWFVLVRGKFFSFFFRRYNR